MSVRVEIFATGGAPPEDTWAIVGDLRRVPEWTDADRVERLGPEPVEVGTQMVVVMDGHSRLWRVVTVQPRLLEVRTDTARGTLEIGVRVIRERAGSRLVLAGVYRPGSRAQSLRARAVDAPALRRRFDRWTHAALELASAVR